MTQYIMAGRRSDALKARRPTLSSWPSCLQINDLPESEVERVMGIEPTYAAWEAAVLPLNYTREAPHSN
jgi:hypothetical protein